MIKRHRKFGSTVRALRNDRGIGLRRFAKQVGISPTYLSKIERGEFPPPAEDKIVAIANALDQDRDMLLALAGRVSSDLEGVILRFPQEIGTLLRHVQELASMEIEQLTREAERLKHAPLAGPRGNTIAKVKRTPAEAAPVLN